MYIKFYEYIQESKLCIPCAQRLTSAHACVISQYPVFTTFIRNRARMRGERRPLFWPEFSAQVQSTPPTRVCVDANNTLPPHHTLCVA